jgi:hypothetical protein
MNEQRVFLLSPANAGGPRARMLLNPHARFELARRMQTGGAPIGEVFAFISGLYFRGKITYANRFANPPAGIPGALVITAGRGLLPCDTPISVPEFEQMAGAPVDDSNPVYRIPLEHDARPLADLGCPVVLLGSIATAKYIRPLLEIFGNKLLVPADFAGRGDMSRGGLLLRAAKEGKELNYLPADTAPRHGPRPPRLPSQT